MKTTLAVLALLFAICVATPQIVLEDDEKPAIDYDIIDHINSLGTTWKAGHNKRFEGLKVKDVKKLCGVKDLHNVAPLPVKDIEVPAALPESFDARQQWPGCIGAIRDQGHCGSCWAFGAAEALSDRFCIQSKGAQKVVLSTQDLTSCDTSDHGCNGGQPLLAWRYMQNTGVVPEACYPYQMGTCQHPGCSTLPTPKCNQTCKDGEVWSAAKKHASSAYSVARNADQIATEIMTNGPVEAAFTVYTDFNNYKSGVYHHVSGTAEGGHAIKVIGWGVESGTPYWLVANSWNTDWGDQGYFKIRRGSNECGIEGGVVAGMARV